MTAQPPAHEELPHVLLRWKQLRPPLTPQNNRHVLPAFDTTGSRRLRPCLPGSFDECIALPQDLGSTTSFIHDHQFANHIGAALVEVRAHETQRLVLSRIRHQDATGRDTPDFIDILRRHDRPPLRLPRTAYAGTTRFTQASSESASPQIVW
jgi:hypothetical protein